MKKIVLASASPRRIEILKNLGLSFDVVPSQIEEEIVQGSPEKTVCSLSLAKARDVASRVDKNYIVIGADTIVVKDGRIFGKPDSEEEAFSMLEELSGSSHSVMTGLSIINNSSGEIFQKVEETKVFFKKLTRNEISSYINSGECMDKAGSYGIQGLGGLFVEKIVGCYFNVVGLPVNLLYRAMGEMGINLLEEVEKNGK